MLLYAVNVQRDRVSPFEFQMLREKVSVFRQSERKAALTRLKTSDPLTLKVKTPTGEMCT